MQIVTLTLNPAFDLHCRADVFFPYSDNSVRLSSVDSGGKGVNISRTLTSLGVPNTAIVALGETDRDAFLSGLKPAPAEIRTIPIPGSIRRNLMLNTDDGKPETRIAFGGFAVDDSFLDRLVETIGTLSEGDILTVTGSLPDGLPMASLLPALKQYKRCGVRIVVDSRSFSVDGLIELAPWLIKPNRDELSLVLGRRVGTVAEARSSARSLFAAGIENVMVSLGRDGAILVCKDGEYRFPAPELSPLSTVGAGDSSIAGFITATMENKSAKIRLATAVAYGSAACLTPGSLPPLREDIDRFLKTTLNREEPMEYV